MNKMILAGLACLGCMAANYAHPECAVDADALGATYRLATVTSESGEENVEELVLWRNAGRAAHVNPETQVVELWELTANKRVRLVRFFDEYQRGIEYQPGEVDAGDPGSAWELKRQLVSTALIESLGTPAASGEGCAAVWSWQWEKEGARYELQWLPALQLIRRYRAVTPDHETDWTLERTVTDGNEVAQAFARRDSYQTTDYADIGDHESDPFLSKMIRLGFVDQGHPPPAHAH